MPHTRGNNSVSTPSVGQSGQVAPLGPDDSDAEKIAEFETWLEVPDRIKDVLNNAQPLRDWMQDVLMKDTEDTVVTHHTLRYVQADLAMLTATDPKANFKPRQKFWGPAGQPNLCPKETTRFAETVEYIVNFFAQTGKLRDAINAAARDAKTVRAGWVKLIWRDDPERTPTGALVHDEYLNSSFRFKYLRDQYRDGEFGKNSANYTSMMELDRYLRGEIVKQYRQQMTEDPQSASTAASVDTPEGIDIMMSTSPMANRISELLRGKEIDDDEIDTAPRFVGFDFDVIDIEDIRMDWSIERPEFYQRSRRMGFRSRLKPQEIVQRYKLTKEQEASLPSVEDEPSMSGDQDDKHRDTNSATEGSQSAVSDGKIDVWEIWDADDRTVYLMICGVNFFLNKFTPRNTGPNWFPFFQYWFNEMSGLCYAPSDVELMMPLQDELNSIRSHARDYRKAAMPRLFILKGAMTPEEIVKFENSHPFQVLEVEKPDDIQKTLFPFKGIDYNAALVSTAEPMMEMQLIAGMPAAGLGAMGSSKLATEVSFASQQLKTQQDRKMFMFTKQTAAIMWEMAHIVIRSLPYENALDIVGPGLQFPMTLVDREALMADLWLDVKVSPTGKPDTDKEMQNLMTASGILLEHGVILDGIWLASELSRIQEGSTDWTNAIKMQDPFMAGAQAGGTPGAPGGARQPRPSDPRASGQPSGPARGSAGGGQQQTPSPSSLPGNAPGG